MDSSRSGTRRSMRKKKREREKVIQDFWAEMPVLECDVITDVVDKGDHVKITTCTKEASTWWLTALKAVFPDQKPGGRGDSLKVHPEPGITLYVNKGRYSPEHNSQLLGFFCLHC
jgi:hypothetical protein